MEKCDKITMHILLNFSAGIFKGKESGGHSIEMAKLKVAGGVGGGSPPAAVEKFFQFYISL